MDYTVEFSSHFTKSIKKLKKKDKILFQQVQNKLIDIISNPSHYKPLKNVLAGYRRIHLGSFVLIYKIEEKTIRIISLDHHDKAY
ncbi:MAG: type II toxin-antitoxin system mRNA interferase toxin, RelE/StbE family [Nanoarchaeota archaeon]|nr:type II toxin-antitoxin system mRNA interferase toxin, RelE/StbE family [Nanoarchaeota archaeon]MBU1270206.1 type II toxin-antitoxin system mRNA interferase toxin, RelE/StbE family [Nanoarchaeota archaeon]MBU1604622.1 type II toxin-antitoxin system mRNA interferase toxin, RelE/StbE family [Nanoarchaeota archaeon]MBU2443544.1 type II toxin-antitoxin system mRNA interferase toxin, RelE/StbE family [Nanoarchaeota archaeon]